MTNQAQTVAQFLTDNPPKDYLESMTKTLLLSAIAFTGLSEEAFKAATLTTYKGDHEARFDNLENGELVKNFYAEHKDDILEFLAEISHEYGNNSAMGFIADVIGSSEHNFNADQIAIALFGTPKEYCDEVDTAIQMYAVMAVLSEICKNYNAAS